MTTMTATLAALLGLLQDDALLAEALKGWKHPWADFREGSRVTYRETLKRPAIGAGGVLVYEPVTTDLTWTVAAVESHRVHLKIEGSGQESVIAQLLGTPSWGRGGASRAADEEVEIGGRKVACTAIRLELDAGKDASQRTLITRSGAVPYWAVRRRVETLLQGKVNTSEEERVVGVEEKLRIGSRDVVCTVVEVTTEAVGGPTTVKREWRTDEVPGRVARRVVRQFQNGKENVSAESQMDVVSFDLKR
jgi:hypothetical protein